uniref:Type-2 restriction enzyme n=1 Tax=Fervidobacterium pennivorans TaxID=93466 RepID=A0A7V4KDN9_FERPE
MVRYELLGFKSFSDYFDTFLETLLKTNKTYEYFVDWEKVKNNIRKFKHQIFLLNSLRGVKNRDKMKKELADLFVRYPEVLKVIPLLIAERVKNWEIDILDPDVMDFVQYNFKKRRINKEEAEKYVYFSEKVGIVDLLMEIKDLYDYLIGVEVGLDTNSRKNRSGDIFESLVQIALKKHLPRNFNIVPQDPNFSLYQTVGRTEKEQAKRHDFVLYFEDAPKFILEANFYNVKGSKPISIAESYINLQQEAVKSNVVFVWITDGPGWSSMNEPLLRAMKEIDFVLNYKMIPRFCSILDKLV